MSEQSPLDIGFEAEGAVGTDGFCVWVQITNLTSDVLSFERRIALVYSNAFGHPARGGNHINGARLTGVPARTVRLAAGERTDAKVFECSRLPSVEIDPKSEAKRMLADYLSNQGGDFISFAQSDIFALECICEGQTKTKGRSWQRPRPLPFRSTKMKMLSSYLDSQT